MWKVGLETDQNSMSKVEPDSYCANLPSMFLPSTCIYLTPCAPIRLGSCAAIASATHTETSSTTYIDFPPQVLCILQHQRDCNEPICVGRCTKANA